MDLLEFYKYDNSVHTFFEGKPSSLEQYDSILSLLLIVNTAAFVSVDISNGTTRNNSASLALLAIAILFQVMRTFVPVALIPFRGSCKDRIVSYLPYSLLTDQTMLVSIVCLGVQFGDSWLILSVVLCLPGLHNTNRSDHSDYSFLRPDSTIFRVSVGFLAISRIIKYFLVVNSAITLKYYGQTFSFEGRMLYLVFVIMDGLLVLWAPKLWSYHSMVEMCHKVCPHGCKPFNKINYSDFVMEHVRPSQAEFKRIQAELLMAPPADSAASVACSISNDSACEGDNSLPLMSKGGRGNGGGQQQRKDANMV